MARLPIPDSDEGTWGTILNEYLLQSHNGDGTLRDQIIQTNHVVADAIVESKLSADVRTKLNRIFTMTDATTTSTGAVQLAGDLGGTATAPTVARVAGVSISGAPVPGSVLTATTGMSASWQTPASVSVDDATTTSKGIVQLAGDLSGTADAPTVSRVAGISISGTPSAGAVLTATNGTDASWQVPAAAGDVSGATNVGTNGVGVFAQKNGTDLEFQKLNAGSSKITVTQNATDSTIDIDVDTANLGLTKADVGLANVDNTSDLDKPLSSATVTALNDKVSKSGDTMTGTLNMSNAQVNIQPLAGADGLVVRSNNTNPAVRVDQWGSAYFMQNVFIGSTASGSNFNLSSSFGTRVQFTTSALTLSSSHHVLLAGGTSDYTITLPDATSILGRQYVIKNIGSANVTLTGAPSQTIEAQPTHTLAPMESIRLVCYTGPSGTGPQWYSIP